MKKEIHIWTCKFCGEKNTNLKNKSENNKIICPQCGKKNTVVF